MIFQNTNKLHITKELLGISDIRVVSSEMGRKGHMLVRVESTVEKNPCLQCGKAAHEQITQWIQAVEASELTCFNTFIKTLKKYQTEIVLYFKNRYSSGFVEGINSKLKVLKRRCYGIGSLTHLFQRAFLDISGFHFFKQNQALEIARFATTIPGEPINLLKIGKLEEF